MDFIRAFSLLVVVAWHWVFTIIIWRDDGPHASNPIGFTKGLWIFTWTLQIMPMFFYVGGYGHLRSWEKAQAEGRSIWELVGARAKSTSSAHSLGEERWRAADLACHPRTSIAPAGTRCRSSLHGPGAGC